MKPGLLIYPLAAILLAGIFYFLTPNGDNRLPFYYTPDGNIIPIGTGIQTKSFTIKRINHKTELKGKLVFASKRVSVITEKGQFQVATIRVSRWKIFYDFKIIVLFAFINLFTAIWILQATRDLLLGSLCLVQTLFSITSFVMVVNHQLYNWWIFCSAAMAPALLNAGLRTTGKETPVYLLVGEVILCLFFALIAWVGSDNIGTLFNLGVLNLILFFLALVCVLFMQLQNILRDSDDLIERYKRRVLFFGTSAGIALPFTLFILSYFWREHLLAVDIMLIPGIIFPMTLIYSTYRLHFVKFQLILTHSLMAGILSVFLIGIYSMVLLFHSLLLPGQGGKYSWIVNIVFILILVFFLDPARRYISNILEKRIYRLDSRLMASLKRLTEALALHSRIQPTVSAYLLEIRETLGLEKIGFIFSSEFFQGMNIKSGALLQVPYSSRIWKFLKPGQLRVSTYLSYAAGGRAELFRFMFKNEYLLGLGIVVNDSKTPRSSFFKRSDQSDKVEINQNIHIAQIKAALMIGHKKNKKKLKLNEIRYLQEASKLAGLLIYNYALLIQEVAKRRRIRELNLAGLVQRNLPGPAAEEFPHINMMYINKPVTSVSGDYLDIITLSPDKFAFMIGDVSGHGLGTGYLVSAARSIIRSHLFNHIKLPEIIDSLNSFLVDRYQGGEFITLFIGILDAQSGKLEYINAAHPGPLIRRANGNFQELVSTQRLIGVLPTIYHSDFETLHPKDRFFLFSDGVTETFDKNDVAFGDLRIQNLLKEIGHEPIPDIVKKVDQELQQFRSNMPLTDDTTFVAFEFNPQRGLFQNLLSVFGLGKKS